MPAESFREGNEEGSHAVAAGSVRQDQGVSRHGVRLVEPASDEGFEREVLK